MQLKKSYKGFVIWMVVYMLANTLIVFLPIKDTALLLRFTLGINALGILILTVLIYLTEKIFWYSGMDYETALKAGSQARKRYAFRHVRIFGVFTAVYLLFSLIMQLFQMSMWADITVFTVGITVAAFSTIRIRL
ncbi:MAG: hypothetical protein E7294_09795 [Lachnospiraceae bacterium]|jgi:hypothetical protein|nr:hypothetical protein [Lachnospiraceae bacterium]